MAKKIRVDMSRLLIYSSSILIGITFITTNFNVLIFVSLLPLILYVSFLDKYSSKAVKI